MDEVTQQNAALVEEAASATEAMREQAVNLTAAVSIFRLAAEDRHAATATRISARDRHAASTTPLQQATRIKPVALAHEERKGGEPQVVMLKLRRELVESRLRV